MGELGIIKKDRGCQGQGGRIKPKMGDSSWLIAQSKRFKGMNDGQWTMTNVQFSKKLTICLTKPSMKEVV
jgi:hypothetical protein